MDKLVPVLSQCPFWNQFSFMKHYWKYQWISKEAFKVKINTKINRKFRLPNDSFYYAFEIISYFLYAFALHALGWLHWWDCFYCALHNMLIYFLGWLSRSSLYPLGCIILDLCVQFTTAFRYLSLFDEYSWTFLRLALSSNN